MKINYSLFALALFALTIVAISCAPAPTPAPTAAPPTAAPAATSAAPPTATAAPALTSAAPTATTAAPAATAASTAGTTIKLGQIQGFGLFLTDDAGRTLYAFDNDKKDTSNCTGDCLKNWPPLIVRETPKAGDRVNGSLLSTFTRADGAMQAEYDGRPLYYYSGDKSPGDVNGHNVGNVWHVLSPRGSPMLNPAPTKAP